MKAEGVRFVHNCLTAFSSPYEAYVEQSLFAR